MNSQNADHQRLGAMRATQQPAKRRVYLNEFNIVAGVTTYLPLATGRLRAYAESSEVLREGYDFQPFVFHIDRPETILARYQAPDLAAFSVSMWNEQLNLSVARQVKERWPDCLIVFGGPQVPHRPADYFAAHPFIDIAVRGEGEEAFSAILHRFLESREFDGIPGVSWRPGDAEGCRVNQDEQPFQRDLDCYPSPYLTGLYDPLMAANADMEFQAIVETNRGCPFLCTFCFWGKGGLSRKYRYYSFERVADELEWCARAKIRYVFNADSNFGMHKRDMDIAHHIVELKKTHGYPEKFRTCYGKNTDERIFDIGQLFHAHDLEKGITLSRQSNNPLTLKTVKRSNIKLGVYTNLQRRFNDHDVPVYCEMLLGLPGETYESFIAGIEELLRTGLKNQVFIYHCQIYENTELADPDYRARHGLETRKIALNAVHSAVHREGWVAEIEETIVSTASMGPQEWRRAAVFAWMVMLMHSLKAGFFLIAYLADRYGLGYTELIRHISEARMAGGEDSLLHRELGRFEAMLDRILAGHGRGSYAPEYGEIYWEIEEFSYLEISKDLDRFYAEFEEIIQGYLSGRGIDYDADELGEAVTYQRMRMPSCTPSGPYRHDFKFNFPEYFACRWGSQPIPLSEAHQRLEVAQIDFGDDREDFARKVIMWGRKSGLMLNDSMWHGVGARASLPPAAE